MQSLNKAQIIGNLTRDPEVRHMTDGSPVVTLNVATSESWKDRSGEKKENKQFHRVIIFDEHLAKFAESFLRKGMRVYAEGQLQTRKWTDKTGAEKYTTEIVMQKFRGELMSLSPIKTEEQPQTRDSLDDDIPF